jgi:RyR domain
VLPTSPTVPAPEKEPQMATYSPRPVDTSDIALSPELMTLLEKLAENTHDTWATQRISDGWSHGSCRDDTTKQHPGLVPYAALSESEKEYDRRTAAETLKLIIKLGFDVVPKSRAIGTAKSPSKP